MRLEFFTLKGKKKRKEKKKEIPIMTTKWDKSKAVLESAVSCFYSEK